MDWAERTYRFGFVVLSIFSALGLVWMILSLWTRATRGVSPYPAVRSCCVSFAWIALLAFVAYAIAKLPW